jgi:hypothetical protein
LSSLSDFPKGQIVKNFDLNVGGLVGGLALGGITGIIVYNDTDIGGKTARLAVPALIIGAVIGNIAWGMLFRKPDELAKSLVNELSGRAAPGGGHWRSSAGSIWTIVGSTAVLVVTLIVEHFTVGAFLKARETAHWPMAKATITRSETLFQPGNDPKALIEYTYPVGERSYQSNRLRTRGNTENSRIEVTALVEKYPVGSAVMAFYNPADPAEAFLESGLGAGEYIMIISPLVFAAAAGASLFSALRGKFSAKQRTALARG